MWQNKHMLMYHTPSTSFSNKLSNIFSSRTTPRTIWPSKTKPITSKKKHPVSAVHMTHVPPAFRGQVIHHHWRTSKRAEILPNKRSLWVSCCNFSARWKMRQQHLFTCYSMCQGCSRRCFCFHYLSHQIHSPPIIWWMFAFDTQLLMAPSLKKQIYW